MTPEQSVLWQRIEAFAFDEPGAAQPFSLRLAKDNGWSAAYARRAIDEYRRFAFLAVAAGHPVSPSDAVDQVWHEHLLYTRSYWTAFCGETLGRPLHHGPSRGGADERAKFSDWYGRTLESYRTFFASEPPADLWPAPAMRARTAERFQRVDLTAHWVVPKRQLRGLAAWTVAGAGVLALTGCGGWVAMMWPLDLRGPAFLGVFFVAAIVAGVAGLALRRIAADAGGAGFFRELPELDAVDAALLAGGVGRAVSATVAELYRRNLLTLTARGAARRVQAKGTLPAEANDLEKRIHTVAAETAGVDWKTVRRVGFEATAPRLARLREQRLILEAGERVRVGWLTAAPLALVLAVGLTKLGLGVARNRPVGFLLVGCGVLVVLVALAWMRRPWRTKAGERALLRLRSENGALEKLGRDGKIGAGDYALALALFGAAALPRDAMANERSLFGGGATGGDSGWSIGSGCGSGCGGGGGGCGGGGCGGCGGD